jgi:hypothetical protein
MEQREVIAAVELLQQWHQHQWVSLPDSASLYRCSFPFCPARAVCLGCQNRLEVGYIEQAGFLLYWCPQHRS